MEYLAMKKSLSAARHYSYTRLALNYYMYCEERAEREDKDPWNETFFSEFQKIMKAVLDGEGNLSSLKKLRETVMEKMEILTAYTDCFQIYEHVLNRLELRYVPMENKPKLEDDDHFVGEVLTFLASSRDGALMNGRIQMVLEQLPIRFTKSKFFSMVQEGMSVYKGNPKSSLDAMLYVLHTESMVSLPKHMEKDYEKLHELLLFLSNTDYRNLSKEEFSRLSDGLLLASETLMNLSSELLFEMDLLNDLYVIHITGSQTVMDASEKQNLQKLLRTIWESLEKENSFALPEETDEMLIQLEGKQERYYERWLRHELPKEEGMDEEGKALLKDLNNVELLLSSSSFVELDKETETDAEVTGPMLEEELQKFFKELETLWQGMQKAVVRAIMARILSNLPLCFNSLSEVEEYMKKSLGSCTDIDEKLSSIELIREIMVEADEMV